MSFRFSEPLGHVKNLQVTDPTTSTLNVRWEPAEGNVREYIVLWTPTVNRREQDVVRLHVVNIMSPGSTRYLRQVTEGTLDGRTVAEVYVTDPDVGLLPEAENFIHASLRFWFLYLTGT